MKKYKKRRWGREGEGKRKKKGRKGKTKSRREFKEKRLDRKERE